MLEYLAFNPKHDPHILEGVASRSWIPHVVSAGWQGPQDKAHLIHDTHHHITPSYYQLSRTPPQQIATGANSRRNVTTCCSAIDLIVEKVIMIEKLVRVLVHDPAEVLIPASRNLSIKIIIMHVVQ